MIYLEYYTHPLHWLIERITMTYSLSFIKIGSQIRTRMWSGLIERRTEVLNMYAFKRLSEVREITDNWIRDYNEERHLDSENGRVIMYQ